MRKLLALLTLGLAACGATDSGALPPLTINRPVDIAFSCYGGMRVLGSNGQPDASDTVTSTAQPITSCDARAELPSRTPSGQESIDGAPAIPGVEYQGFILESVPGTVALVHFVPTPSEKVNITDVHLVDGDPLTPGRNAIAVGELPVAIAADRAGCQMVTANAGTCDLSILDVASFVDQNESTPPLVRAQAVTNASGQPVLAKPAAMLSEPTEASQPIGVACPQDPEGLVYVAYPACHLVAAVRAATGRIEAGIRFNPDGSVDLTDGNVSCPAECGETATPETAGERPVAIDLVHDARVDTRRLVIGSDNSPTLTVVELGADYKPTSLQRVSLNETDGPIGVTAVAMTPQIGMGGDANHVMDTGTAGGQHQFVYAVATDATVRVADVTGTYTECETNADARYVRTINDVSFLSCMPVGDPRTPPRRVGARTPGIETVTGSAPMSVAIAESNPLNKDSPGTPQNPNYAMDAPAPGILVGYMAFITTTQGETFVVNIDDDAVADVYDPSDPLGTQPSHVIAHQIRDAVDTRNDVADTTDPATMHTQRICTSDGTANTGGPRLDTAGVSLVLDTNVVNANKQYAMPSIRRIDCHDDVQNADLGISELSFSAPTPQRELAFPDWRAIRAAETWTLTWEGSLSRDDATHAIDGPVNRVGVIGKNGTSMTITEPSRPFCEMGTEPYDYAILSGCDPTQGDAQCGVGETCYVHPDAKVATGSCLPKESADLLASTCRDYLITMRHFTIMDAKADQLRVVPRNHVLVTTPIDGCTSDQQCNDLASYAAYLQTPDNVPATPITPAHSYKCQADATRENSATLKRCIESCTTSADCDDGTVCSAGRCVEGVVPPLECVPNGQRFQVHAGDAFAVVGSVSGFLHPIKEDSSSGECVVDPTASPLQVGRIKLTEPPCPGPDSFTQLTPNPCQTTVQHTEKIPDYKPGTCDINSTAGTLITRDATAIRFKNPAITFHLVDPSYPGDAMCREDRGGTLQNIPTVHPGYQIQIPITSGFLTLRLLSGLQPPPVLPVKIKHGPVSSLWVMDEGDYVPEQSGDINTRGQVIRFEATNLGTVQVVQ